MFEKFSSPERHIDYERLEVCSGPAKEEEQQLTTLYPSICRRHDQEIRWTRRALLLFVLSNIILLVAYMFKVPSDLACARRTSIWSPAHVAVEYNEMDFDNDFAHKTIYRGPPTPALEDAWKKLWKYGSVRIPEEKVATLNRTVDLGGGKTLQHFEDEKGGYRAMIENMIRQYTWHDWYLRYLDIVDTPENMKMGDVGRRMYADHCIEALRISLMCQVDTTPLFLINDPESSLGWRADFSAHQKCRDFDKIRSWTEENQMG